MKFTTYFNDFTFLAGTSGRSHCSKVIFDAVSASETRSTNQWDPGGWDGVFRSYWEWAFLLGSSLSRNNWTRYSLSGWIPILCWALRGDDYSLGAASLTHVHNIKLSFFCVVWWQFWVCIGYLTGWTPDRSRDNFHIVLLRAASCWTTVHCYGVSRGAQDQRGALVRLLPSPYFQVASPYPEEFCWRSQWPWQWQRKWDPCVINVSLFGVARLVMQQYRWLVPVSNGVDNCVRVKCWMVLWALLGWHGRGIVKHKKKALSLSSSFPSLGIWTLGSWPLLASIGFKDLTPSQPFLFAILLLSIYFTLVFHIEESVYHIEKSFCMHFILYISIYSMFDRNKRNMLLYVIEHIMSRNHCDGSSDKGKSKRDFEVSMQMTEKNFRKIQLDLRSESYPDQNKIQADLRSESYPDQKIQVMKGKDFSGPRSGDHKEIVRKHFSGPRSGDHKEKVRKDFSGPRGGDHKEEVRKHFSGPRGGDHNEKQNNTDPSEGEPSVNEEQNKTGPSERDHSVDHCSLSDYHITSGSTVQVMLCLRGGSKNEMGSEEGKIL